MELPMFLNTLTVVEIFIGIKNAQFIIAFNNSKLLSTIKHASHSVVTSIALSQFCLYGRESYYVTMEKLLFNSKTRIASTEHVAPLLKSRKRISDSHLKISL